MTTIIIPAHNEEKIISNCLKPFIKNARLDDLEVIVVCNGCSDLTVNTVKKLSDKFVCLETDIPSKTHALNLGDEYATSYPRIYLDADIVISFDAVEAINTTLKNNIYATSLEPKMDLSKSSWPVKAFYEIWLNLPYCKAGMIGSGLYALSEKGRSKFDQFPNIIADDGFVRCLFKDKERIVTKDHFASVSAPYTLSSLIKIRTRSRLGRYQLKDKFPDLLKNETKDFRGALKKLFFDFKLWPKLFIYFSVNIISRMRAKYQYLTKRTTWERDDSRRS
jgi:glycosyltransferase involved in cell wall biosynthesis